MKKLQSIIEAIPPRDESLRPQIQAHLDNLTKPQGSLGRLEELALEFCLMTRSLRPVLERKRICCLAGDHGVAAEGVSAYPKEVTPQMVLNMLGGGAAINVLTRHIGADLQVVDIGVDAEFPETLEGLHRRKVARGTANIAKGPAMSREQTAAAIRVGLDLAKKAKADGMHLLGTGDMGIANTTPAAALCAAYLGLSAETVTGRGTSVNDTVYRHKIAVIKRALAANRTRLKEPLDLLAALGGFEIAGICGLALGGAAAGIPVVVDGFISTAGSLAACRIEPKTRQYLFFAHCSAEQGHQAVLNGLSARPILDLDMRLGEGTGAALAMTVIQGAVRVYNEMATFKSAGVSERAR